MMEPLPSAAEPFVVKHYAGELRPSIKGNGFDGLEVGEFRQDAEDFITWINQRLARLATTEEDSAALDQVRLWLKRGATIRALDDGPVLERKDGVFRGGLRVTFPFPSETTGEST